MKAKNPEAIKVEFPNGQKVYADLETLKVFFEETGLDFLEKAQTKRREVRAATAKFDTKKLTKSKFPVEPVKYPWRSVNAPPSPALIYHKKDAVGIYPYGAPCIVYHETDLDKKEYWSLVLSSNYMYHFDTAEYDDEEGIKRIYQKFVSAEPETLAIEMFLSEKRTARGAVEKNFVENIEYAKNVLSSIPYLPPIPSEVYSFLLSENVSTSQLSVIDPLLFRLVSIPGMIELSHSSVSPRELNTIARKYNLVPVKGRPPQKDYSISQEGSSQFYVMRGHSNLVPKTCTEPFYVLGTKPIGISWDMQGLISSNQTYNKKNSAILNKDILSYEESLKLRKKYRTSA